MLSTHNHKGNFLWLNSQEILISKLKKQPLIIVFRPGNKEFKNQRIDQNILTLIESIYKSGIVNIEIAWSPNPRWKHLIKEVQYHFPDIFLGAASVNSYLALKEVINIGLPYAMTPLWSQSIQKKAIEFNQLLVPGVSCLSQIHQAQNLGYKIVKIFPASEIGINYIEKLKLTMSCLPLFIAAGGLNHQDIRPWLSAGYSAITLGRKFTEAPESLPYINSWVKQYEGIDI